MIRKNITITEEHEAWLKRKSINLSALVQESLDKRIKNESLFRTRRE